MAYKAKVRVKSLHIEENNNNYTVSFNPIDKIEVCNESFVICVKKGKITTLACNILDSLNVKNDIFNFISDHIKETFVITFENASRKSGNKNKNSSPKYKITEVELIYG